MFGWKRYLAAGAATAALVAFAPAAQSETLADALIAAYKTSHLLDQNRALLRAADEDLATAVSSLRPVIAFVASAGRQERRYAHSPASATFDSTSITLSAELVLLDFGRREASIGAAKEAVLATRAGLVGIEQGVLLSTVEAYVNVRLAQEIVDLRRNNVRVIGEELKASQDRFDVGEVTRTDVAQAESALGAARAQLAAAEGDLLVQREAYKALTGAYPGKLAPVPAAPKLPASLQEATAIAMRNHPQLIAAQHSVKAAELNVELAKANMRPQVGITASVGSDLSNSSADYDYSSVGVSASQTLYSGGRLTALMRRAYAGQEAQKAALLDTTVSVEQSVANAWSSLQVLGAQIAANTAQIEAAQTAFEGVREEAKLGARTTLDVLDAEQNLLDARAARFESEANRYYASYAVLAAMGQLTVEKLNLGIPTYDVTTYYNAVKNAPAYSFQGESLDRVLKALNKD